MWYGAGLDWGRVRISGIGNGRKDLGREPQFLERYNFRCCFLNVCIWHGVASLLSLQCCAFTRSRWRCSPPSSWEVRRGSTDVNTEMQSRAYTVISAALLAHLRRVFGISATKCYLDPKERATGLSSEIALSRSVPPRGDSRQRAGWRYD